MRLYHTTPRCNLRSIFRHGLLTGLSKGALAAVWLHTEDRTSWAFLHCVKRHGGRIQDVVTIECDIPDDWIKRSSADGLFYATRCIPELLLGQVKGFSLVASSPLENGVQP